MRGSTVGLSFLEVTVRGFRRDFGLVVVSPQEVLASVETESALEMARLRFPLVAAGAGVVAPGLGLTSSVLEGDMMSLSGRHRITASAAPGSKKRGAPVVVSGEVGIEGEPRRGGGGVNRFVKGPREIGGIARALLAAHLCVFDLAYVADVNTELLPDTWGILP
jgi:hypothetical protein